jgi:hypothetical protein
MLVALPLDQLGLISGIIDTLHAIFGEDRCPAEPW